VRLIEATAPAARTALVLPLDEARRSDWHYTPRSREGLAWKAMSAAQAQLLKLIAVFANHLQPELAQARRARVLAGPAASIRFAWAGSTVAGEPHYFRIQGSNFLIEFDNSGGNHIHTVWRDFEGDFGRDVLREHYQRSSPPKQAQRPRRCDGGARPLTKKGTQIFSAPAWQEPWP
jgi:hypothetical protein